MFLQRILLLACMALASCASHAPMVPPMQAVEEASGWHAYALPGKRSTDYQIETKDGRRSIRASADRSASLWRRSLSLAPDQLGDIEFSWWVDELIPEASLAEAQQADSPARLVLTFDGDVAQLSTRNRLLFDLASALSGEAPPYATLMYVWESSAPVDSVIISARTDRVRKIVVESGAGKLRQWRHYRRDVAADFRRAFGESPGVLTGVALMTDADNTQSRTSAWYGQVRIDGVAGL